jgi:hypothetical protein
LFLIFAATAPAWGAITIDQVKSTDSSSSSTSITSPSFSTTATNELLLAFVSTGASSSGITVTGVTGASQTWALVWRTNTQRGTAEIWRAFASATLSRVRVKATLSQSVPASITVVTFTGTDTSGTGGSGAIGATAGANARSGAPSATLVTTRANSWVFGVGTDTAHATSRTLGANQTLVHQYLASSATDTYWVQQQSGPTTMSGTSVTINDTAPTGRYNLSIVEILPALAVGTTYSISGSITNGAGSTVTLTQGSTTLAVTTADGSGNYSFTGLANGTYTVTPTATGLVFTPTSLTVTINGGSQSANFTAAPAGYTVSGSVTPSGSGATVTLAQGATSVATVAANASGSFSFTGVANGSYTVTPAKSGFTFSPTSQSITVSGANVTGVSFSAAAQTWTIQGTIAGGAGATVALTQGSATITSTTADASGNYTLSGVVNGTYTVTPSNAGYTFSPASQSVIVNGANLTGVNFSAAQTWTIQGTISGGSGATVTLTQGSTTIATTTANGSGNFTFTAVNGNYTVTPTKSGYSCDPASQSVTVNGAPVTGVNFTATPLPTYTISGNITNGSGASVTLSGAASATTTADTSGNFSFSRLSNGTYTVAASKPGLTILPASQGVTVNNADVAGVNFTALAALGIDVIAYGDTSSASTSATTSTFSTASANELLLAFIASDATSSGMTVTGVTGGSLTWALIRRTNTQMGTAEVWRAFAPTQLSSVSVKATLAQSVVASITVVTFTGTDTSGASGSGAIGATASASASSGAPTASLVTTRNNSWVLGVGNDYDKATARTVGANQTMVHQLLSTTGDTYWVQRQNSTTAVSGTTVTINDTAPTGDRYNLTLVEVLPPAGTYSISGSLSAQGGEATVTLSGAASAVTAADSSGNYAFNALANGSYTVTPSKNSVSFSPPSQTVTLNGGSATGVNFTASLQTWSLSGNLSPASNGAGATVTLGGPSTSTVTADTSGNYSFSGLTNGTYSVTPSKSGYSFSPTVQTETINGAAITDVNFTVSAASSVAITISPTSASLTTGGTQQFTATVTGSSNTNVTWSVTGGKISSGLYTAPSTAGTYTVTATAVADTTKSASATVTVTLPSSSTVLLGDQNVESQADSSLPLGQAEAFQATASASGIVQSLVVYLDSTSTVSQLTVGLYADASGHPGTLLSQGSSTTPIAGAWNPILVPAATLEAGTPYWIVILGTTSGTLAFREAAPGSCASETSAEGSLPSLPSTWTTGTVGSNCPASVFGDSTKVVFFDNFPGTALSSYWTIISRHGEYTQNETECNVPSMVSVNNGLTITTEAQTATCGDYFNAPSSWPYITGDVQWANLNFTYGSVEIVAKFPSVNTSLWPATWLLGSNCQYTNPLTGNTGVTINGHTCPDIGRSGYTEIDLTECYGSNGWCQFHVANPSFGIGNGCDATYTVDTNFHTFTTVWNSSGITQYMDGVAKTTCKQKLGNPMFLLIQTQTGGAGGTPNNAYLPATLIVDYVKVTQP